MSEDFQKINLLATLPAATDDDLTLTESNAILQNAADLESSSAYAKDFKKRENINRWLLPSLIKLQLMPRRQDGRSWQLSLIKHCSKSKWLTGGEISIAEIAIAAPMHLHKAQQLPLDNLSHLKRWIVDIEQLSCWQQTQSVVDKALMPEAAAANGSQPVVSGNGANGTTPKDVRAKFNYTKDVQQATEIYFYESEQSKNIHAPGDDPHDMTICDGWHRSDTFSVDREGSSLHEFVTAYDQWDDDPAVAKSFYPEIVDFLEKNQGAKRVLVLDHAIRSKNNEAKKLTQESNASLRTPVMLVHCDYTAESGPLRMQQQLSDEAQELLSRRVAFFNVWKPIRRVVEEHPLAMCDLSSSPQADLFKLYL
ncbi:MAG: hypothetical protein Q9182_004474 [Xanthomendoza sp. 2 TL-2023]